MNNAGAPQNTKAGDFLIAVVLSLLPGVSQLRARYWKSGALFLTTFIGIAVACFALRLPSTSAGLLSFAWASLVLFVSGAWHFYFKQLRYRFGKKWLLLLLLTSFAGVFIYVNVVTRAAGFRAFIVMSDSMAPAMAEGDRIMVDLNYFRKHKPKAGDVVVFRKGSQLLIKRIAAEGGQKVKGIGREIYIDSRPRSEPYAVHSGYCCNDSFAEREVPRAAYFVLGDNRDFSFDSRFPNFGFVTESSIVGKPLYVLRNGFNFDDQGKVIH